VPSEGLHNSEPDVRRRLPLIQVKDEQRTIIKLLTKENLRAHAILAELQAGFENKVPALPTVRFWMEQVRRGPDDLHDEHRPRRPPLDDIDTQIMRILGKSPFKSTRSRPQRLGISQGVGLHHLHEVFGFKRFHLRWVPHLVTDDLGLRRKRVAREMMPDLETASRDGWQHFVTGAELCSFLYQSPQRRRCFATDHIATIVKKDIHTQKFMFTITWNPRGHHVVNQLPNDTKMNDSYFTRDVLTALREEFIPRSQAGHLKPLAVPMDNLSVHTSGATQVFMSEYQICIECCSFHIHRILLPVTSTYFLP
jgi:hypothetical protein